MTIRDEQDTPHTVLSRDYLILTDWKVADYCANCDHPLRQILIDSRDLWDTPEFRESVRKNFIKVIECGTAALGSEVFASDSQMLVLHHRCKSRTCPSCGHRATQSWQRNLWAALPDVPYASLTFTMPEQLWPLFHANRRLRHHLPALGAEVVKQWAAITYGVRLLIAVVPHSFGRHLNFNPHLHLLASNVGIASGTTSGARIHFDRQKLMKMWRFAVIRFLREAEKLGILEHSLYGQKLRSLLQRQYERPWSVHVANLKSKAQFLRYAGRYVRRPPIAQYRFLRIDDGEVHFWTKDLRLGKRVVTRYKLDSFVRNLAEHVPDHYAHSVRYFGLLAPRSVAITGPALFWWLGQRQRRRPKQVTWRESIKKTFGRDPQLDKNGHEMHWVGRRQARTLTND
jgi:hypothetical protein